MRNPRRVVNAISLSRIVLAMLFVLCFQRNLGLLWACIGLFAVAFTTDLLDGYLARRLKVASLEGRLYDALGDKAFYVAAVVAFIAQGFLLPVIGWALIVREVALYVTRILFIKRLSSIEHDRRLTELHGYLMRTTIVLGLWLMRTEILGIPSGLYLYIQLSAVLALVAGCGTIAQFLKISEEAPSK